MGTDLIGRDVYSRIVYAARVSLSIGVLSQVIALAIGVPLGGIAGWRGGKIDYAVMRLVDVMSALPTLLLAFLIVARMGASYWNVLLAIGLTSWIEICRLTRGQFLSLREKEFVEASRMIGLKTPRIIRLHLLPNALAPIIVSVTLGIPRAIFAEAALSFLGMGINPPTAKLGPDARRRRHRQHDVLLASRLLPGALHRIDHARLHAHGRRVARCVGSADD